MGFTNHLVFFGLRQVFGESVDDAGWDAAHRFADELQRRGMSHLEALIRHQTGGEAPLWLSAFGYFLRREIIDEPELRDELYCDSLLKINLQENTRGTMGKVSLCPCPG